VAEVLTEEYFLGQNLTRQPAEARRGRTKRGIGEGLKTFLISGGGENERAIERMESSEQQFQRSGRKKSRVSQKKSTAEVLKGILKLRERKESMVQINEKKSSRGGAGRQVETGGDRSCPHFFQEGGGKAGKAVTWQRDWTPFE